MSTRATMADVAREAGVSPSTASRVLYKSGYVSQENRERVLAAVSKVGYRPNIQARSLRNQRSYALGLVVDSATNNAHFAHIAQAMRIEAAAAGYSLLTVDHEYSAAMEREGLKHLLDHNVEAIVVCHPFRLENFNIVRKSNVPLIQIERKNLGNVHRVEIDPIPGIDAAVRHLVALRHHSIGYVSGTSVGHAAPQKNASIEDDRIACFLSAVSRFGLKLENCPIWQVPYDFEHNDGPLRGYTIAKELLQRENYPSALIAGGDVLGAGILQAAGELGLSVPRDLSLVGFDDSLAKFLAPPLSTIAQPHGEIARQVLQITRSLVYHDAPEPLRAVAATRFVSRQSTGPAPVS